MALYTTEIYFRVYDDDSGDYIEIAPGADGLGLVEIISYDKNRKAQGLITCTKDMMKVIDVALSKYLAMS